MKVLFYSIDGYGHINNCLGLAKILAQRNHEIIFALSKKAREKLITNYGYKFILIESTRNTEDESQFLKFVQKNLSIYRLPPIEFFHHTDKENIKLLIDQEFELDEAFGKIMDQVKPEVIIVDSMVPFVSMIKSNIPWISCYSANPLLLFKGENLPPSGSGLSINSSPETKRLYLQESDKITAIFKKNIQEHLNKKGCNVWSNGKTLFTSPYLNFYSYNQDLDYTQEGVKQKGYFRIDGMIRDPYDNIPFTLPKSLEGKPGGLIYLSLGTLGSCDTDLMNNLIRVLSKSPHRIIVSTGPIHNQLKLGENMWGEKYLDQIKILPHVNVVITHGGNNTFNECLYFAKPMIVLPIFFDQLDNAQRIADKGLGIRLDTYNFKDEELLDAIEVLMNDQSLRSKLESISQKMKSSKAREKACDLIEQLAQIKHSVYDYVD